MPGNRSPGGVMKLVRTLVPGALLLLLAACSSSTFQAVPRPDLDRELDHVEMARIYLFRDHQPFGKTNELEVHDGHTLVGRIGRDEFLCWERLPGPVRIRMVLVRQGMQNLQGISVPEVKPGRTHHWMVRLDEINRRPQVLELTEDQANELLPDRQPAPIE